MSKPGLMSRMRSLYQFAVSWPAIPIAKILYGDSGVPWSMDGEGLSAFQVSLIANACIDLIATAFADVPIAMKEIGKDGQPVEEHAALDLLAEPNKFDSGKLQRKNLIGHLYENGNAYLYKAKGLTSGEPLSLTLLPAGGVQPIGSGQIGVIEKYKYTSDKGDVDYSTDQIIHLRLMNPDDWKSGASKTKVARDFFDIERESRRFFKHFFRNAMAPRGAIKTLSDITGKTQFDELEEMHGKSWDQSIRTGRPLTFSNSDWVNIGINPKDASWGDITDKEVLFICYLFKVPPEVLGVPNTKTYDNYHTALLHFYRDTVLPIHDEFICKLNQDLLPDFYGQDEQINVELISDWEKLPVFIEEAAKQCESDMAEVDKGLMTRDEYRQKRGRKDLGPATKQLTVVGNSIALESIMGGGDYSGRQSVPPRRDSQVKQNNQDGQDNTAGDAPNA